MRHATNTAKLRKRVPAVSRATCTNSKTPEQRGLLLLRVVAVYVTPNAGCFWLVR